ncbi:hypothetical protein MMC13_003270 [Lambiella insularis]|nr:hypothetical protein [Lambiella insularis]
MLGKRKRLATVVAPKKKKKSASAIEEITFDFDAREDYLSGFHKRKLQRIKHAQEEAAKKGREDRINARKHLREGRKADLEKHVEAVNMMLRKADQQEETSNSDGDEGMVESWSDVVEAPDVNHETDYEDEDKHTTVTIEAVNVTRAGLQKVIAAENWDIDSENRSSADNRCSLAQPPEKGTAGANKRIWTKQRPEGLKKKKKKFRYESKGERKITRYKERSGNKAKAKARKD